MSRRLNKPQHCTTFRLDRSLAPAPHCPPPLEWLGVVYLKQDGRPNGQHKVWPSRARAAEAASHRSDPRARGLFAEDRGGFWQVGWVNVSGWDLATASSPSLVAALEQLLECDHEDTGTDPLNNNLNAPPALPV